MVKKILRVGYYGWPWRLTTAAMSKRATNSKYTLTRYMYHQYHFLTSPWPFSMRGIDVIRRIEPTASNGNPFILVAIHYFTKWVEAVSYANVTRQVVAWFIRKEIIWCYGLLNKIITNNLSNLNIEHHNSSPYRPKINSPVEAANKNIKKINAENGVNL